MSTARGLTIPTTFTAVDQMSPGIRSMSGSLSAFATKAEAISARSERLFRRVTPAFGEAQKQLLSMIGTASAVSGLFLLGRSSIDSIKEYENAIMSLQAVTGVSDAQMSNFKKEITAVANQSKKSSIDVAKSFEVVGSMMSQYLEDPKGLRTITEAGIMLSKASRQELEPSLQALTSVMNQFGLKAEDAAATVQRLTAGEIVGSVRTSEAASMLQEFGAVAKNTGVSVAESTALIEALGMQMDKSKIGVGARNLLTVMGAAGGLDKRAIKDLQSSGVNTKVLMDNTRSLSERLHELSKIAKDPIKMVSVFGKENLTAGQVIFQQLATYDAFVNKIEATNEAQRQAAQNSSTLSEALRNLSNKWVNMLTTSDKSAAGLERAKNIVNSLADNLDTVVDTTISVVKYFALWKAGTLALSAVSTGYNIVLGARNALQLQSLSLLEGNIVATKASIITEKLMVAQIWLSNAATSAWAAATAIATGNQVAFNVALAANPVGIAVIAVTGLVTAIGALIYAQQKLRAEYEQSINARVASAMSLEISQTEELARNYIKLGYAQGEAMKMAIAYQRSQIEMKYAMNRAEVQTLRTQLREKQVMFNGALINLPGAGDIQASLLAKQQHGTELMSQKLALTNYAISKTAPDAVAAANKSRFDLSGISMSQSDLRGIMANAPVMSTKAAQAQSQDAASSSASAQAVLTIKNDSESSAELNGKGKTVSILPRMTSTMSINSK